MSNRELIVLGTASQTPTRQRAHNSYALRWDDQLILFDPGEGTQRQCTLAGISIAKATAVCITHFHGDHCLGLPGVIQRRSLDNNLNSATREPVPLPIFFPADGQQFFDRLRSVSIFEDASHLAPTPIVQAGVIGTLGNLTLSAVPLEHRVTTYGYRLDEPDKWRVDVDRAAALGVEGRSIGRALRDGQVTTADGVVARDQIASLHRGQSMAFVMDTRVCDGAAELASGVDLLVCESTYLHEHADLADKYMHMTARQAGELAAAAGAKRLVLTHFSARYGDTSPLGVEARGFHDDVVVARDLVPVPVPRP